MVGSSHLPILSVFLPLTSSRCCLWLSLIFTFPGLFVDVDPPVAKPECKGLANDNQTPAMARRMCYTPMAWLGVLRPIPQAQSWTASLCQTFTTSLGFQLPLSLLSRASSQWLPSFWSSLTVSGITLALQARACNSCESHSSDLKPHDRAVDQIASRSILHSAGHSAKCQDKV